MHSKVTVSALEAHEGPTSHRKPGTLQGQTLYLRYRATCFAIRFWRKVRDFANARYGSNIETGLRINRRLAVRASYAEVVSR